MMTQFTDAYMRHRVAVGFDILLRKQGAHWAYVLQ